METKHTLLILFLRLRVFFNFCFVYQFWEKQIEIKANYLATNNSDTNFFKSYKIYLRKINEIIIRKLHWNLLQICIEIKQQC